MRTGAAARSPPSGPPPGGPPAGARLVATPVGRGARDGGRAGPARHPIAAAWAVVAAARAPWGSERISRVQALLVREPADWMYHG